VAARAELWTIRRNIIERDEDEGNGFVTGARIAVELLCIRAWQG
tara:strand:- start:278 stop:409 length:132 start_codon:yes stop_codon:yes gene_type:complete